MKKLTKILVVALLIAMLVPVAAMAENVVLAYSEGALYLRKGPGKNYKTNGTVHDGDEIDVLREGDVWSKVETEDGRVGYIKNLYIDGLGDDYASGTEYFDDHITMYTTGNVRFRAGASTETDSMGTFAKGTKVTALGKNGRFYLVKDSKGAQGFVSSLYLSRKYVAPSSGTSSSKHDTGVIVGNTVNVRAGGGMSYSVVAKVYGGQEVDVLYVGNYWTKIETSKGVIGWVNNAYIR